MWFPVVSASIMQRVGPQNYDYARREQARREQDRRRCGGVSQREERPRSSSRDRSFREAPDERNYDRGGRGRGRSHRGRSRSRSPSLPKHYSSRSRSPVDNRHYSSRAYDKRRSPDRHYDSRSRSPVGQERYSCRSRSPPGRSHNDKRWSHEGAKDSSRQHAPRPLHEHSEGPKETGRVKGGDYRETISFNKWKQRNFAPVMTDLAADDDMCQRLPGPPTSPVPGARAGKAAAAGAASGALGAAVAASPRLAPSPAASVGQVQEERPAGVKGGVPQARAAASVSVPPEAPVRVEPAPLLEPVQVEPAPLLEPAQEEPPLTEGQARYFCRGPADPILLNVEVTLAGVQACGWEELGVQRTEQLLSLQLAVATGVCEVHPSAVQKLYELLEAVKASRTKAGPQRNPEYCWGEHLCSPSRTQQS